jgi:hypothetical protein
MTIKSEAPQQLGEGEETPPDVVVSKEKILD